MFSSNSRRRVSSPSSTTFSRLPLCSSTLSDVHNSFPRSERSYADENAPPTPNCSRESFVVEKLSLCHENVYRTWTWHYVGGVVALSVEYRTRDQEVVGSTLGRARGVKTLGMFLTPMCLCSPSSTSWYRPKGGDTLRLGSKGRYGLCWWQVKLCDPLVTHGHI